MNDNFGTRYILSFKFKQKLKLKYHKKSAQADFLFAVMIF